MRRAVTGLGDVSADGIPYLQTEVQPFAKARDTRPKDEQGLTYVDSGPALRPKVALVALNQHCGAKRLR